MRERFKNGMSALCAAALLCALCVPAQAAADPYYSGELDAQTGEEVTDSSASSERRVQISETTWYDREARAFAYPTLSGISEVRASVADGMIVTEAVRVTADEGVELTLSRGGAALESVDWESIDLPGSYVVAAGDAGAATPLFSFTIVGAVTNLPGGYVMPEGFYILDATLDGEDAYFERNFIGMEDEGQYEIEYVCPDTSLHYHLTTAIDRTPPEITLEGSLDKNGRFHSAVQIGGLEQGGAVSLTRDGAAMGFPSDGKLTEAGMYQLQVYDAAGNSAARQFTILAYLDLNSLLFIAAVCLSAAGVLGYIFYRRKILKVV